MSHCILWIRTTRAINTYSPLDFLPLMKRASAISDPEVIFGEMRGADSLAVLVPFDDGAEQLAALLATELNSPPIEDWQVLDVGHDAAWQKRRTDDAYPLGRAIAASRPEHYSLTRYAAAKGLLVTLDRDIDPSGDKAIERLQRSLGREVSRHWQSRSMILLAFVDRRDPDAIVASLGHALEPARDWGLFTLGARTASKASLGRLGAAIRAGERADRQSPVRMDHSSPRQTRRAPLNSPSTDTSGERAR